MNHDDGYISDFSSVDFSLSLFDGCLIPEFIPGFPDRMGLELLPYTLGQENVSWRIKEKEK